MRLACNMQIQAHTRGPGACQWHGPRHGPRKALPSAHPITKPKFTTYNVP
jgi:hypothetical protein